MFRTSVLAMLCVVFFSVNSEARQRHKAYQADPGCNVIFPCEGVGPSARGERIVRAMGGFGSAQKVYIPRAPKAEFRQVKLEKPLQRSTLTPRAISATIVSHPSGCPSRAFCGCGAAVRVFGSPVRSLWLAANWFKFPRAAPAAGMVAVRNHHVFVLEADLGGGRWQVYDANSGGHATRIHARSIAGYQIVNPHGGSG